MDQGESLTVKDAPHPKVMKRRMYVGGVISRHRKLFAMTTPGLEGCMRDFRVNDRPQNLLEPNSSRDIVPCALPNTATFVHEGGFATFGQ